MAVIDEPRPDASGGASAARPRGDRGEGGRHHYIVIPLGENVVPEAGCIAKQVVAAQQQVLLVFAANVGADDGEAVHLRAAWLQLSCSAW